MTEEEQIEFDKNIATVKGEINRYNRLVNVSGGICAILLINALYCLISIPLNILQILPIGALIVNLSFFVHYKNKSIHHSEVLRSMEKSDLLFFNK